MTTQDPGATPDPTADTKPATTTDTMSDDVPLGDGGKRALDAERKARRDAERRAQAAEERAAALEADQLRRDVATTKGIPADLLTGTTLEELEAHADRLLAFRGDNKPTTGGKPREKLQGGATPPGEEPDDMAKVADRILNRGGL